jgi:hypothetical protein
MLTNLGQRDEPPSWHHPVKKVFAKYAIKIDKVHYSDAKPTLFFTSSFPLNRPKDSRMLLSRLEAELFVANGHYDYAMQDDSRDALIEITWNKKKRELQENFISTGR